MYNPELSTPEARAPTWVAKTDPKQVRAWIGTLPLGSSTEAARDIYQTLYAINRIEMRVQNRLELMALYDGAVASVNAGLQPHLATAVPPLGPKRRQLAEFMRRLHVEMAYGYKSCLRGVVRARVSLRRKSRLGTCIERTMYHLGEVLMRSYLVYLPYPAGVWREMHELYRLAERFDIVDEKRDVNEQGGVYTTTIGERYRQALLLGLINPYQLPYDAVRNVYEFLRIRGAQAQIVARDALREPGDLNACFLIQLASDAPAVPLTGNGQTGDGNARVLDARTLLQSVHSLIARLERGERIERLGLGIDCLDSACNDLLNRMIRAWGESARRRYTRRQRSSNVFIAIGINAVHYFTNGQRPFATYLSACPDRGNGAMPESADIAFIDLDDMEMAEPPQTSAATIPVVAPAENFRIGRWRLRDIGPQGLSIARYGDASSPTRVGELVGVQQPSDLGRWRPAVIRWVKTPEANSVEAGLEMLAAVVTPVAIRCPDKPHDASNPFPALQLPAAELTHRPSTLLLPSGMCRVGDEVELLDEEGAPRRIRLLRLLERTGSFEQMVFGEIVKRGP